MSLVAFSSPTRGSNVSYTLLPLIKPLNGGYFEQDTQFSQDTLKIGLLIVTPASAGQVHTFILVL